MTIDEAIKHCQEIAKESRDAALTYARSNAYDTAIGCKACAQEHDQIARWLEELKQRRKAIPVKHGKWIDKGNYAVCTECGGESGTQYDGVEPIPLKTQFCPHCGVRMGGGIDNG